MSNVKAPKHTGCSHELPLRNPKTLKPILNRVISYLRSRKNDFDGIAVSGYSMGLINPIIAYQLKKLVCVIAKPDEKRNSYEPVEGIHSLRWIMIDDLISSSKTLSRVGMGVEEIEGKLVGLVLWHQDWEEKKTIQFSSKYDVSYENRKMDREAPLWLSFNYACAK
jgi:hypothetical protein